MWKRSYSSDATAALIVLLICCLSVRLSKSEDCSKIMQHCFSRSGCTTALGNYMYDCSEVVHGVSRCPEACQHALIALTSTNEGKRLMNCTCNDNHCQETKQKVDICRAHVMKALQNDTMTCLVSELICIADSQCSMALQYYRRNCKSMFKGEKCSRRCRNSINILKNNEKTARLSTCICDGREDYDCLKVQNNMMHLCFHKRKPKTNPVSSKTNRNRAYSIHFTIFVAIPLYYYYTFNNSV